MKISDKKYTCAIIDDDSSSVGILTQYIAMVPKLRLYKSYLNPTIAIEDIIKKDSIDMLFLDINMPISGLDVARVLRDHVKHIIFVTGHSEYALAAFGAQGDAFLVKPVSFAKFLNTLNRLFVSNSNFS